VRGLGSVGHAATEAAWHSPMLVAPRVPQRSTSEGFASAPVLGGRERGLEVKVATAAGGGQGMFRWSCGGGGALALGMWGEIGDRRSG
jgi:hypothetical protein